MKKNALLIAVIFFVVAAGCSKKQSESQSEPGATSLGDSLTITEDSLDYVYKSYATATPPCQRYFEYKVKKGAVLKFCTKNDSKSRSTFLFVIRANGLVKIRKRVKYGECDTTTLIADKEETLRLHYHFKIKPSKLFWSDVDCVQPVSVRMCECEAQQIKAALPFPAPVRSSINAVSGTAGTVTTSIEEK